MKKTFPIKLFLLVLVCTLTIPLIGYVTSFFILKDIEGSVSKEISVKLLCENADKLTPTKDFSLDDLNDVKAGCNEYGQITLLGELSISAGIIPMALILIYIFSAFLAGTDRKKIALIFKPLILLSTIVISVMVLLQGGILTYAVYIVEVYLAGSYHPILIGGIGIGALLVAFNLITSTFSFAQKERTQIYGNQLTEERAPDFFKFVSAIAEKLGAVPPNQIIMGIDPSFYVTSSDVTLFDGKKQQSLTGETLYVSAPLVRLMKKEELAAVIGHELAHFRGDDTTYSLKFAPIFRGLESALGAVDTDDEEGASGLAKLPALALLSFMHDIFSKNEAAISRERELVADNAATEVSSGLALVLALAKLSLYSSIWPKTRETNIQRLQEGKIAQNLSVQFIDTAKYDVEHEKLSEIIESILEDSIEHPTDTHPPIKKRMETLNVKREDLTKEKLLVPKNPASTLFGNLEKIEQELSMLEHQLMVTLGRIEVPETEADEHDAVAKISYCLGAAMINADGKVLPDEITMAEGIGQRIFSKFDAIEFREYVNDPEGNPDIDKVIILAKDMLTKEGRLLLFKYLKAIAEADGEIDESEQILLQTCAKELEIDLSEDQETA